MSELTDVGYNDAYREQIQKGPQTDAARAVAELPQSIIQGVHEAVGKIAKRATGVDPVWMHETIYFAIKPTVITHLRAVEAQAEGAALQIPVLMNEIAAERQRGDRLRDLLRRAQALLPYGDGGLALVREIEEALRE